MLHTGSKGNVGPLGPPGYQGSCKGDLPGPRGLQGPGGYPGNPGQCVLKSCVLNCQLQMMNTVIERQQNAKRGLKTNSTKSNKCRQLLPVGLRIH